TEGGDPASGGFAWISSSSTWVPGQSMWPKATRRSCSDRAAGASPPRRTGRLCWAPSTTRWSPVRGAASPEPTARPKPLSPNESRRRQRNKAWLAGGAGLTAVATIVGTTAARSVARRTTLVEDPYADEDFEILEHDRSSVVTTFDGVELAVREVGPQDARLTVVFAHGFCLRMGAFHFQRARLTEEWGSQVRMVFYDQRGHGCSGEASPDTYTVPQLGMDLEAVLRATVPHGPIVLVGHSMGGMTVLSHARQYPSQYGSRIVGAALIASAARG